MGLEDLNLIPVLCCGCCCFWVIFAVIAIPLSFKSLEQGKFALELNWMTQQIGDEVVTDPGMKMVGLGNMLVEFPSTFQTMYFANGFSAACNREEDENCWELVRGPIRARSRDGLEMQVSVSFQWKLEPQSLQPLYSILGAEYYIDEMVRFARASIVRACTSYTAESYFTNRTAIRETMLEIITAELNNPEKQLQFMIKGLQLREVDLPDAFDREIANTRAQMQEIEVAQAEREEKRIAMDRELQVTQRNVDRDIQLALGEANQTLEVNNAIVQQMLNIQRLEAKSNAQILSVVAEDPNPWAKLFELMELGALKDHNSSKLLAKI